ncbi:ATP-binding protein [Streptomyces sp. NBC_01373]|nr:ATP-binding protein [Streptomyces sp. NBC_01373]
MDCVACMPRKSWELAFLAEPEEVPVMRRALRAQLENWGLREVIDAAQLCASELVSNVIHHVGAGTPAAVRISMEGTHLRLEVRDPDTRALPTLVNARTDCESGRGMTLISAMAERWGVQLLDDSKVTWCELATSAVAPNGHRGDSRVSRAERMLGFYGEGLARMAGPSRLRATVREVAAIDVIADLLHWLRAHGLDVDEVLDRAQAHFEAEIGSSPR